MKLEYNKYFDKVYGCWLGKCISGTIGAPYEGMKQYINLEYTPELFKEMLPNDDLDLQVLWLDGLERKGVNITIDDLAEIFSEKNIYWPGEYAWFKKNYDRGIRPPYTGIYENDFYFEGMGCPIRGEIWGMIYPCNSDGAAEICEIDGNLDHYGNSVYFEKFWSAIIAASFYESDIRKLFDIGLKYVPNISRAYSLITDVIAWCEIEDNCQRIMGRILSKYGHKDCTNSFQNIGIIIFSLLKGKGDIIETSMIAVRNGFDTDCTAGNIGALLGAILGAEKLQRDFGFKEAGYKLTLNYARKTDRVYDLAVDTCRVGLHFIENGKNDVEIIGAEHIDRLKLDLTLPDIESTYYYKDTPYIQPGQTNEVEIELTNQSEKDIVFNIETDCSNDFIADISKKITVPTGEKSQIILKIKMYEDIRSIAEKNIITVNFRSAEGYSVTESIGIVGRTPYLVFGPFWENIVEIPDLKVGESYYGKIHGVDDENYADNVRCYHLNTRINTDKEYITLSEIEKNSKTEEYEKEGKLMFCDGDVISFNDFSNFNGQCALYLKRIIVCNEDRTVNINIGHTDAFMIWLNGTQICERNYPESWTPENAHLIKKQFVKGENTLVIKLLKRSENAKFTITFTETVPCPKHIVDLISKLS